MLFFLGNVLVIVAGLFTTGQCRNERRFNFVDNSTILMEWDVDYRSETIRFQFKLKINPFFDHFIFGFSDSGEVENADISLMMSASLPDVNVLDAWVNEFGTIIFDSRQDWVVSYFNYVDSGLWEVGLLRDMITCDMNDLPVDNGTTQILIGYSAGHPWNIRSPGVVTQIQPMQLMKPDTPDIDQGDELKETRVLDVALNQVEIPAVETTYWCTVIKLPEYVINEKQHIYQYEAVISEESKELVHHMELFHCEDENIPEEEYKFDGLCDSADAPAAIHSCRRVLAAWAMGADPMKYPESVGLPFGGSGYVPFVRLEVHFNNPKLLKGKRDSSGIRFHHSTILRPIDAGILEVGLEYTDKMAIPPGQALFPLVGYCIPQCTEVGIPPEGISIFASQLHAHLASHQLETQHVRNGFELPILNRDNHFTTHWQEIRILKEPRIVMPGDALITTCLYDTRKRKGVTLGGNGIMDEMCVNYIHYYPKMELEVCKSSVDSAYLDHYFELMSRIYGDMTLSDASPAKNYHAVQWNQVKSDQLLQLYSESPLSMQCNRSDGRRFPGYWENQPRAEILLPFEENEYRKCYE